MKIREITESRFPSGIKVMSPEEFVQQNHASAETEIDEADLLGAPHREFGSQEFQDYARRIQGEPDVDPATGQVRKHPDKISKSGKVTPGAEKYVSGKLKTDKYKMPYIHRSSIVKFYSESGRNYDEAALKRVITQRPAKLLKQNEKMEHSSGEFEQFFNIGFAALTGIAVDQSQDKLIIVNTCPGAGGCKIDCFAMGGGKIQFENAWLSDARILTFLLNDPEGFKQQLKSEISNAERKFGKDGISVSIRWHDAGDFFSPEYLDLAFEIARAFPKIKFYAYTKIAAAVLSDKPSNFIINWSEGASASQERQVKQNDAQLKRTKNSRIVQNELFYDLLVKDDKKRLVKGASGQWQIQPDKLPELKQRLARAYGLSANSILSYAEWAAKTNSGKLNVPIKYNVIIAPGEPDITANSHGVISTLLLKH